MSELKVHRFITTDELFPDANAGVLYYDKSEADKVIAELKNRIAPKQPDKTLQERLNEVCKKHAVSTLQDLDWSFCMVEARLEDYTKLAADKHEVLEKMLQYKGLYKEKCRDINTQERFFAMKVAHANYKRCLAMAKWCSDVRELMHKLPVTDVNADRIRMKQCKWCRKWRERWLAIAEQFKPNYSTSQ